ncbi:LOW QUALITY PROTEIN: adenylate cyclase type 10 [Dromiciops gliroides]|uniref:LOW QUALITY PROTEIN: adenylate cyclase type 10 n=1 Tax=Dromiciops gliroides TaxID=33562 RepID=UPI001CC80508|nr:LOW QUALITY PROTEIN: adenylate cyclase type 10 [Dromiciops gliroides]
MNIGRASLPDRTIVRIAAHLPDLIVYGDFTPERPSTEYFDGVLMFVDISGFTAMTEKFSTAMYMDRGAEQLVDILNRHISVIVEKVLIFGGDILKFAGDALLALWKVERKQLKNFITVVVKCSLEIHGVFENQESEEGLDIRVKIGLSAGHIKKLVFGDEKSYFLVIGQAVEDVRFAQSMAQMNDIILSPNCWQLCDRSVIEIERIPDQRAVKVNFLKLPPAYNFDEFFTKCMENMDYYPSGDHKNILRLASTLESDPELEISLQKYIMRSILKQIDDKQLRGYLSELRPVTIVFVNLQFEGQETADDIGQVIQDSSVYIDSVLKNFKGQINKVFMFDKGCSFLCVFGFPGEKAPDEITHALESAVVIFDYCSQIFKIKIVSIGVASGIVFCGIVGHSVRHEYTGMISCFPSGWNEDIKFCSCPSHCKVIGQKVNIAARMMMYYPGIVTCDAVTYSNCSFPSYFFKELPKQHMKGVAEPGPVYQCLGLNEKVMFGMSSLSCNRHEDYPLLGRNKEIRLFLHNMKEFLLAKSSQVLMFEGVTGYGKSQLVSELGYLAQGDKHRVIALGLTKVSIHQYFHTIQLLMASVLGLDTCKHYKERQHNLEEKFKNYLDEQFYCILNDIFHVQFPLTREACTMSGVKKQKEIETLFMNILNETSKYEKLIFIIDEAQYVDITSWEFLEKLIRKVNVFLIMSLSPFVDTPCKSASAIMKNRNTTYVIIGEISSKDIRSKVCLDLNVASIPKELEMYLVEGSCGIPLYCEELLRNLDHHKVLIVHQYQPEEKANVSWHSLFKNYTKPQMSLKIFPFSSSEDIGEVCDIASGVRLKNMSPPSTLKEISLVQLDSMSLSQQMLVRCAAIIGQTFTTALLFEILPCWNMKMMVEALATLVQSSIFYCFQNQKELRLASKRKSATFEVHHRSLSLKDSMRIEGREEEKIWILENEVTQCRILRFCKPIMQKTAYELWLKDQKAALHVKCARFLEESAHKCEHCGSGDFIPFHHYAVDIRLNTLDLDTVKRMIDTHGFEKTEEVTRNKIRLSKKSDVFTDNLSPEEIGEKILYFFDVTLNKIIAADEILTPIESCQCQEVLESVLLPLAYHFTVLEELDKALYYYLEIVAGYITLHDNYLAYIHLCEGERLLKSLKHDKSWSRTFEFAIFYTLKGQVSFNVGQMALAKKMMRKALKLLKRVFPYSCISVLIQTQVEKNKHAFHMSQQQEEISPPGKGKLAQLHQQISCLSSLWQIYSLDYACHCKNFAHLAAMMQVNSALETKDSFQIIKAYLDYSLHSQLAGYQGLWFKYEVMAIENIFNKSLNKNIVEIIAYVAEKLSYIKYIMGYLELSIQLGFRAHDMWQLIKDPNRHYFVLQRLTVALFLKNRHHKMIEVMEWMWSFATIEEHVISQGLFYFTCLDILLYAGFIYRTFEECLEFISEREDNKILRFHSGLLLSLYSDVAIWFARLEEWENFEVFFNRAKKLVQRRTPSLLYCEGFIRYTECQALCFQKQLQEQIENVQDIGVELLKSLENLVAQSSTGPIFHPRIYHLMAYACLLMGDEENCNLFLRTALEICDSQGNVLEKTWLNISKKWWFSDKVYEEDSWLQIVLRLPKWDDIEFDESKIKNVEQNKFRFKITITDNF